MVNSIDTSNDIAAGGLGKVLRKVPKSNTFVVKKGMTTTLGTGVDKVSGLANKVAGAAMVAGVTSGMAGTRYAVAEMADQGSAKNIVNSTLSKILNVPKLLNTSVNNYYGNPAEGEALAASYENLKKITSAPLEAVAPEQLAAWGKKDNIFKRATNTAATVLGLKKQKTAEEITSAGKATIEKMVDKQGAEKVVKDIADRATKNFLKNEEFNAGAINKVTNAARRAADAGNEELAEKLTSKAKNLAGQQEKLFGAIDKVSVKMGNVFQKVDAKLGIHRLADQNLKTVDKSIAKNFNKLIGENGELADKWMPKKGWLSKAAATKLDEAKWHAEMAARSIEAAKDFDMASAAEKVATELKNPTLLNLKDAPKIDTEKLADSLMESSTLEKGLEGVTGLAGKGQKAILNLAQKVNSRTHYEKARELYNNPSAVINDKLKNATASDVAQGVIRGGFIAKVGVTKIQTTQQRAQSLKQLYSDLTGKPVESVTKSDMKAADAPEIVRNSLKSHSKGKMIDGALFGLGLLGETLLSSQLKLRMGQKNIMASIISGMAFSQTQALGGMLNKGTKTLDVYAALKTAEGAGAELQVTDYMNLLVAASPELKAKGMSNYDTRLIAEHYKRQGAAVADVMKDVAQGEKRLMELSHLGQAALTAEMELTRSQLSKAQGKDPNHWQNTIKSQRAEAAQAAEMGGQVASMGV